MKSLRSKLLITISIIIILASTDLTLVAYLISKKEMTTTVKSDLDAIASQAAAEIYDENGKEFKMLESLASLSFMRDPNVSLAEKHDQMRAIASTDDSYINIAFYDQNGNTITHDSKIINMASSGYFKEGMKGHKTIADPYVSTVQSLLVMIYAVPVFDAGMHPIGVIAAVEKGDKLSKVAGNITIGKSSHPSVINMKTGINIGDQDIDNVIKQRKVTESGIPQLTALLEDACKGNTGGGEFTDNRTGKIMTAVYRSVGDNCDWAVFCAAPKDDFFMGINRMVNVMIISFIIEVIVALGVCGAVITISINPLKIVDKTIHGIASGNADLTQRIKVTSKDEIGSVVSGFNKFTEELQSIISGIKNSKNDLTVAGDDLQASTDDTSSSITQILANIESVRGQITNQSASVEETAGAVNEIASNIASLEKMIENQSSGVTQASAAVEEMIGNIGSVNQSVDKMASSFDELQTNAQNGSAKQQDVNERIEQIEEQSQMLQEANIAIASIAEQTNLLAMNAAIEAAHAGEAGKGFSVVADEIRKLSETSSSQSKTIGDQLNKIKESINSVVSASAESSASFMTVSGKIKETDELVRQIKSAMEEQTEGSKQISEALHSMNDSTSEVRTASAEMSAGNKAILEEVQHLQEATGIMKDSMSEMSVGARKINETGAALLEISSKMKDSITHIGTQIDQFKV